MSLIHRSRQGIVCALSTLALTGLAAAGTLAPPAGPVAATMKALDEVEPRIAVNAVNTPGTPSVQFKITQSGSYYLTGNIVGVAGKAGILISSSDVTLDLMGFSVIADPLSIGDGVKSSGLNPVTIRNGIVRDWPGHGVNILGSNGGSIEGVKAINCGGVGIWVGSNFLVRSCIADGNASDGILTGFASIVSNCTSSGNTGNGIIASAYSQVIDCSAQSNGGIGITAPSRTTVRGCVARLNGGVGISANSGAVVENCTSIGNTGVGFAANGFSVVRSCTSDGNLDGFDLRSGTQAIYCVAQSNTRGFVLTSDSVMIGCSAISNTSNGFEASFGGVYNLSECNARGNGGDGFSFAVTSSFALLDHCGARGNTGDGIDARVGSRISNCSSMANTGAGIRVGRDCLVSGNLCSGNGVGVAVESGIIATGRDNRIEGNDCTDNDVGVEVTLAGNLVIANSASGNASGNFSIAVGNVAGPIVTSVDVATNKNPGANYSY